ncbi:peptide chain release factor N(5)-glutamine methyltransferase [Corynebacterium tapiri]|uniref:peptide chain release factor N(5)-glutamine methyltransferase n=1 Tax=Corynebacterium tapiri TaxID=1448266 RepID=UPI0015D5825F|nr:peptide chain release factor N(5)-glutamine methyltransferase [Corynebacterium tapiri]
MLLDALAEAKARLAAAGVPTPEVDARLLAAHVCGVAPLALDRRQEAPVEFFELVKRREAREPLQHIVGTAPFGPHDLRVGPGVFIPRPETEVLADWAAAHAEKLVRSSAAEGAPVVVDLCTGSGALACYIAARVPQVEVWGVEKQVSALGFAVRNAPEARIVQGDVTDIDCLAELNGQVDIVVTNPPYVPETPDLEPEVYCDPPEAVFAGADGLEVIRAMAPTVERLLKPGGVVGFEHDDNASELVAPILRAQGLGNVRPMADLTGTERFTIASKVSQARTKGTSA